MNAKKQIILFSGVCLAISLILIFSFIAPLIIGIKNSSLELIDIEKELSIIHEKAGGINDTKEICDAISPDLERSENLFVNLEVPVSLMEFLENNADNLSLSVKTSPVFLKEVKDDIWDFVGFRLTITGSYDNFMRFIEKIESAPFLTEIQELSARTLTSSELGIDGYEAFSLGDVSASLTIKVFGK